jgi:hypothetical protein
LKRWQGKISQHAVDSLVVDPQEEAAVSSSGGPPKGRDFSVEKGGILIWWKHGYLIMYGDTKYELSSCALSMPCDLDSRIDCDHETQPTHLI